MRAPRKRRCVPVLALCCAVAFCGCASETEAARELAAAAEAVAQLRYDEALALTEHAAETASEARSAYRLKGIALYRQGHFDEAAEAFRTALSLTNGIATEQDVDISLYLARTLREAGDYEAATEVYGHILALYPSDEETLFARGCALLQASDLTGATRDFDRALSLKPDDIDLRMQIFMAYAQAGYGDTGKAVMDGGRRGAGSRTNRSAYERGVYAFCTGDDDAARAALEQAVTEVRGEKKVRAALLLGQTAEKQGDSAYAYAVYTGALEAGDASAALYLRRGICLMKEGRYGEAVADFETGIAQGDIQTHRALLRNLIAGYEYTGNFTGAKERMEIYTTLYPDDTEAAREAAFLQTR